jgi:hypothetical protein
LAFTVALASARRLCLLPFADFELFEPLFFAALPLARGPLPALLPDDVRDFALVVFDFARGAWSFVPCCRKSVPR